MKQHPKFFAAAILLSLYIVATVIYALLPRPVQLWQLPVVAVVLTVIWAAGIYALLRRTP